MTSMTVEELREAVAGINEEVALASAGLDICARASEDLSASRGAQTVAIGRMTRWARSYQGEPVPQNYGYTKSGDWPLMFCTVIGQLVDLPEKNSESANH